MPTEQERLDRTLEEAFTDTGVKAAHFAQEKNRLESVFATLTVPAIISLGSLWADSDDIIFKLVSVFATGFFFVYAALIGFDLAKADNLRRLVIKSHRHLDTFDWSKKDTKVETLLPVGSTERSNYNKFYSLLCSEFYWSWNQKLFMAMLAGIILSAGYGIALGSSPVRGDDNRAVEVNASR